MRFGQLLTGCRDILGDEFGPTAINFSYPKKMAGKLDAILPGSAISYAAPENQFIFASSWLKKKLVLGNASTHASVVALCEQLFVEIGQREGYSGRVQTALAAKLGHNVKLDEICQMLDLTPRTLRRKLESERTNYRDLVNEFRMTMAMKYLRESDLKVSQIAEALGFSEEASFRRALLRWSGQTPRQIRLGSTDMTSAKVWGGNRV